ncbi:hypothetical protein [Magnetococcus marinus]|nr:hypothetical protein [Magnetococcus marinus]
MLNIILETLLYLLPMLGVLYLGRWLWNMLLEHIETLPRQNRLQW